MLKFLIQLWLWLLYFIFACFSICSSCDRQRITICLFCNHFCLNAFVFFIICNIFCIYICICICIFASPTCSICSFVKDVRFRCNFRFNLSLKFIRILKRHKTNKQSLFRRNHEEKLMMMTPQLTILIRRGIMFRVSVAESVVH